MTTITLFGYGATRHLTFAASGNLSEIRSLKGVDWSNTDRHAPAYYLLNTIREAREILAATQPGYPRMLEV